MNHLKILVAEPIEYAIELGLSSLLGECTILHPSPFPHKLNKQVKDCDLVLSCLYHSPSSILIALLAKRHKRRLVYFSDGIDDWSNMTNNPFFKKRAIVQHMPAYADIYFVCNVLSANMLSAFGKSAMTYLPNRASPTFEFEPAEMRVDYLITTANTPYFDSNEKSRLISLLSELISAIRKEGATLAFRIYDSVLIEELAIPSKLNFVQCTFSEAMAKTKSVITTPSTIALTAMTAGLPVALLDYRDSPLLLQTGWRIHFSTPLSSTLQSMRHRETNRMLFQYTQLARLAAQDIDSNLLRELMQENEERSQSFLSSRANYLGVFDLVARRMYKQAKGKKLLSTKFISWLKR